MKKLLISLMALMAVSISMQAVTFKVKVPDGTPKVYVCGDFNSWDVSSCPQLQPAGENYFTLDRPDLSQADVAKGYKYVCGQDWKYVEKDANGGEINNRTQMGDPDIVESWATTNLWDIKEVELTVNGIPRLINIYLPKGYEDSQESYPVIYYNTVQQRYSNAGADDDNGDNFFSALSWNAQATMENLRESTGKAYVMVQIHSMLGENTVSEHQDFKGTGEAEKYLSAFVSELMPYIEKNYRVKTGKENTVIVGADYGALFSLFAAVSKPDVFGFSVVMSPMLWINEGEYEILATKASKGQNYYISAGSKEPDWIINPASNLAEILKGTEGVNSFFTLYNNAAHNDDDWGLSFPYVLDGIASQTAPDAPGSNKDSNPFNQATYTLFAGENSSNLQKIGNLEFTQEFHKTGESKPCEAFVITYTIPKDYKSKYYWNISVDDENGGNWLLSSPKNIGFSSSRNETSWHNIALFEDLSVSDIAAHSKGFRVKAGNNTTMLEQESEYVAKAVVPFSDTKSFQIKFGSVNSNSEQSALTPSISVSDNCTAAEIIYDFHHNKVTVTETEFDGSADPVKPDFASRVYTVYGGEDQTNLKPLGRMNLTEDYRRTKTDSPVTAFVFTNDIPVEYKSNYYWNIAEGENSENGWVLSAPKSIGFSSKKTEVSWHNIALLEDESVSDIAAHSKGFRVVAGTKTIMMDQAGGHTSKATVSFSGPDKSFQINYGSVNSASDMGAITPVLGVSQNCVEAEIIYDFTLNKVNINETKFGEIEEDVKIVEFKAVPSVAPAGSDINLYLALNKDCDVAISCKKVSGGDISLSLKREDLTSYSSQLNNLSEGVYTLSLTVTDGSNVIKDVAPLNIIITSESQNKDKELTVNAYENIDWNNTGRYKANFHTHTSQSFDTQFTTSEVVDRYQSAGYDILALTDHDANSYPWSMFSLYNPKAEDRDADAMGMLSIPGNELSKDRRNSWSEKTGGEFNHHNDFFTGRKGQEFMSLRESYAYSQAIGGLQIINHPGQYWNLSTEYKKGEKNSPEWHAENFNLYESLIGLEVYNQGNRRPNDRILWDQILTMTMPQRPVWGYSCDDTHTLEQYFRNYQYMLMPQLSVDALKDAMKAGSTVFSYEYTGSGKALAPTINSIDIDKDAKTITIDTDDADKIEWIYSTYRTGSAASTTKSAVVGYGKTFDYSNYQGTYVRALLTNSYGETATQPFGFTEVSSSKVDEITAEKKNALTVINQPGADEVTLLCTEPMLRVSVVNSAGSIVKFMEVDNESKVTFSKSNLTKGVYIIVVATENSAYTGKILR